MPLYNSSYLKKLSGSRTLNESKIKMFSDNPNEEFDIFLSHSYLDKDEIRGLYFELTDLGYKVYVDWIVDSHLNRNDITLETAKLVRERLSNSKSLLLAISTNANLSKWMPWELGFVDGNTNRCAIVPVSRESYSQNSFKRAEYLLLYPYLDKQTQINRNLERIWVNESENNYVLFENWINGQNPFQRG